MDERQHIVTAEVSDVPVNAITSRRSRRMKMMGGGGNTTKTTSTYEVQALGGLLTSGSRYQLLFLIIPTQKEVIRPCACTAIDMSWLVAGVKQHQKNTNFRISLRILKEMSHSHSNPLTPTPTCNPNQSREYSRNGDLRTQHALSGHGKRTRWLFLYVLSCLWHYLWLLRLEHSLRVRPIMYGSNLKHCC